MAVLFANAEMRTAAHAHPQVRDAHGVPVATGAPAWGDAHSGSVKEIAGSDANNGAEWSLRLDPAHWPLERDDKATDGKRVWIITDATLHQIAHPDADDVDYIAARAVLAIPEVP